MPSSRGVLLTVQYLAWRLSDFIFPEQIFHDANSLSKSEVARLGRNAQLLRLVDLGLVKCDAKCRAVEVEPEQLIFDEIEPPESFDEPFFNQLLGLFRNFENLEFLSTFDNIVFFG